MSGMAELLYNHQFSISGSDINISDRTRHLESIGVKIYKGHDKNNINQSDLIVYSSAVELTNPEIKEGKIRNIPIVKRAELLGEIIKIKQTTWRNIVNIFLQNHAFINKMINFFHIFLDQTNLCTIR